jgi:anthranilate synthase component I
MTEQEFFDLARQGYNRIPLVREMPGDLETPLSVYLKLANAPYSYLLESVVGGERFGRYSFIGLPARTVIKRARHLLTVETDGKVVEEHNLPDPLAFIAELPGALQGRAGGGVAALHRRPGRLFRLRHHPLYREAPVRLQ